MRRTPVVLGVLSIVFGSLVAAYASFQLASQSLARDFAERLAQMSAASAPREGRPDPRLVLEGVTRALSDLGPYPAAISAGLVVLSLALIGVGVGLYRRQPWSRPAALLWSAAALIFLPFEIYIKTQLIVPRVHAALLASFDDAHLPTHMLTRVLRHAPRLVTATDLLVYAPFPIVLLFLMGRASAKGDLTS
jgi:hypothetical protein